MPGRAAVTRETAPELLFAGEAIFTVESLKTGARFTYRVSKGKSRDGQEPPFFVAVLTGSNNQEDYEFLGTVFDRRRFFHGKKSRIKPDAPSARVFAWFFELVASSREWPPALSVNHEGYCMRCGRLLTTPESVERGLGPECAKKTRGGG